MIDEAGLIEAIKPAVLREPGAQGGANGGPAADADVEVVALREDPAVAAGNAPEVEGDESLPFTSERGAAGAVERVVGLERDRMLAGGGKAEGARGGAVHAVGADQDARLVHVGAGADDGARAADLDVADAVGIAEVGTSSGGVLGEEGIEAGALGHAGEDVGAGAVEAATHGGADAHAIDLSFGDGGEVEIVRRVGAERDAAAAGLIARKGGFVEEEDAGAFAGEEAGGGAAGGPGACHDGVVTGGHVRIVRGGEAGAAGGLQPSERAGRLSGSVAIASTVDRPVGLSVRSGGGHIGWVRRRRWSGRLERGD